MRFEIPRSYTSTARLFNHTNPEGMDSDAYVPIFDDMGTINCSVAVDAVVGRTYIMTPELLPVADNFIGYVSEVRNPEGKPYVSDGYMYKLSPATPVLNAYGSVIHYKYNLLPVKK